MPPDPLLNIGDFLAETYEIHKMIGDGGTGQVYLARNMVDNEPVAIKALKPEFAQDQRVIDMLVQERRLLSNIHHPAIVRHLQTQRTSLNGVELYFLVMQYIDGPSVAEVMQTHGPMPQEHVLTIGDRVLDGLSACHARGIYHRDISPDNILLHGGYPEQAVLIDFGVAKEAVRANSVTQVGQPVFVGKYEYAAPEQIYSGGADNRTDYYSLGVTLMAAARGVVPTRGERPDPSDLPSPLREIVFHLTQPNPIDRPQDPAEALALFRGTAHNGALTPPPPPPPPVEPDPIPDQHEQHEQHGDAEKPTRARKPAPLLGRLASVGGVAAIIAAIIVLEPFKQLVGNDDQSGATVTAPHPDAPSEPSFISASLGLTADIRENGGQNNAAPDPNPVSIPDSHLDSDPGAIPDSSPGAMADATPSPTDPQDEAAVVVVTPAPPPLATAQADVDAIVAEFADCGPLTATPGAHPEGGYAADAEINVSGYVRDQESLDALSNRLTALGGGHAVTTDQARIVPPMVCQVRNMLDAYPAPPDGVELVMHTRLNPENAPSDAASDAAPEAPSDAPSDDLRAVIPPGGLFEGGAWVEPVLHAPADMGGHIYAFLVYKSASDDEMGVVFFYMPTIRRPATALADRGLVEIDENGQQTRKISLEPYFTIEPPYYDMDIYILIADTPFLDIPIRQQQVSAFTNSFQEALAAQPSGVNITHIRRTVGVVVQDE